MAAPKKRAKIANRNKEHNTQLRVSYAPMEVVKVLDDSAVVKLDSKGTLGVVSKEFVIEDRNHPGTFIPANLACPATYDAVARQVAINQYRELYDV